MPPVLGSHLRGCDLRNDVIGCQNISMLRIDDDARARCLKFPLQLSRHVEKFPEQRIAVKRIFLFDTAMNGNVHHARGDLANERREGRQLACGKMGERRRRGGDQPDEERTKKRSTQGSGQWLGSAHDFPRCSSDDEVFGMRGPALGEPVVSLDTRCFWPHVWMFWEAYCGARE